MEKLLMQLATAHAADGAPNCQWEVRELGEGTLIRLYGLPDLQLAQVATRLFELFRAHEGGAAHKQLLAEIAEVKTQVMAQREAVAESPKFSRRPYVFGKREACDAYTRSKAVFTWGGGLRRWRRGSLRVRVEAAKAKASGPK